MPKPVKDLPAMSREEFVSCRAQIDLIQDTPMAVQLLADIHAELKRQFSGYLCGVLLEYANNKAESFRGYTLQPIYEIGCDTPVDYVRRFR